MAVLNGTSGNDTIFGTPLADVIRGNSGNDRLLGQGGADLVQGNAGRDSIEGGTGGDVLEGGSGDDLLVDRSGSNILRGDHGSDRLVSNQTSQLEGGTGDDTLVLDLDGLVTGDGSADFQGGVGADRLVLDVADASMRDAEGTGIVTSPFAWAELSAEGGGKVSGTMGIQTDAENPDTWARIKAGEFREMSVIDTGPGSSLYYEGRTGSGEPGAERVHVVGSGGDDFLNGGHDNEVLTPGEGADTIYVSGLAKGPTGAVDYGFDVIHGFNADEGDVLLLGYEKDNVRIAESGDQTLITCYVDGQVAPASSVLLNITGVQDAIFTDIFLV